LTRSQYKFFDKKYNPRHFLLLLLFIYLNPNSSVSTFFTVHFRFACSARLVNYARSSFLSEYECVIATGESSFSVPVRKGVCAYMYTFLNYLQAFEIAHFCELCPPEAVKKLFPVGDLSLRTRRRQRHVILSRRD